MMMLDVMQSVGLGAGGVGLLVAAIGYAVRRLADSRLRLADARVADAEARRIAAEAERSEAERTVADGEMIAGLMAELATMRAQHRADMELVRRDVEACRASHTRTDERLARALRVLGEVRRWAERVSYEMQRRGMTPPEMPAALLAMEVE